MLPVQVLSSKFSTLTTVLVDNQRGLSGVARLIAFKLNSQLEGDLGVCICNFFLLILIIFSIGTRTYMESKCF